MVVLNTLQKLKGFPTYLKHIKPNNTVINRLKKTYYELP